MRSCIMRLASLVVVSLVIVAVAEAQQGGSSFGAG